MDSTSLSHLRSDGFLQDRQWLSEQEVDRIYAKVMAIHHTTRARLLQQTHLYFKWAADLVTNENILADVASVIGDNFAVQTTMIFIKPPRTVFEVPPHQDGVNNEMLLTPEKSASVWLAITDCTERNGCLRVYPKTHLAGYLPFEIAASNERSISGGRPTQLSSSSTLPDPINIEMKRGLGCMMHVCLVHDSKENSSDKPRIGLNVRYVAPEAFEKFTDKLPPLFVVRGETSKYSLTIAQAPGQQW
jgi:ectoine hydroxylase-related dioxygenase (phytanoyl-CoA dioxygenase family)